MPITLFFAETPDGPQQVRRRAAFLNLTKCLSPSLDSKLFELRLL